MKFVSIISGKKSKKNKRKEYNNRERCAKSTRVYD